jgi:hydroxyacylglutathione hydrolase
MNIEKIQLGDYRTNCYIISNDGDAMVIDPGFESEEIIHYLKENLLALQAIYITHGHHDHVGGVRHLKELYNCMVFAPQKDKIWLGKSSYNRIGHVIPVDQFVNHGDTIDVLGKTWTVYETPGHTEGSTALYCDGHLFSGDTLFFESIGRSDLPLSNPKALHNSIKNIYQWFEDETIVYPGHGKTTTIVHEKMNNPYINHDSY